jgi:gluconate 5-dehydrogenase
MSHLFDLWGKVAVVTGGASGLGRGMALGLAEAGADIVVADINQEGAEETCGQIEALGRRALAVKTDVTREADVRRMAKRAAGITGRIDVLVNNAGIGGPGGPPEKMPLAHWEKMIAADLTSVFLGCREVGKDMIRRRYGKIVNVSSIFGLLGSNIVDAVNYNAAKGGVIAFTRDLAVKWAKYGIRVNGIAPGYFRTPLSEWTVTHYRRQITRQIPLRKIGRPEDLAGTAVFLSSPASDYMTGQTLVVDGGFTLT